MADEPTTKQVPRADDSAMAASMQRLQVLLSALPGAIEASNAGEAIQRCLEELGVAAAHIPGAHEVVITSVEAEADAAIAAKTPSQDSDGERDPTKRRLEAEDNVDTLAADTLEDRCKTHGITILSPPEGAEELATARRSHLRAYQCAARETQRKSHKALSTEAAEPLDCFDEHHFVGHP